MYISMIKVNKFFSCFSYWNFVKGIENMFSGFISSYRNTRGSAGELAGLEKAQCRLVFPQHFSFSQSSPKTPKTR